MTDRDYYKSGIKYVKQDDEGGTSLDNLSLRTGIYISDENYKQKPPYDCTGVHISSKGPACFYLEADTDNFIEEDVPILTFTQDGGTNGFFIEGHPSPNFTKFVSAPSTTLNEGMFKFYSAILVPKTASDPPTYNTEVELLSFDGTDMDVHGHTILNVIDVRMTGGIDMNGSGSTGSTFTAETLVLNTRSGSIETVSLTTAAGASGTMTLQNDKLLADSRFLANISDYTGTTGIPLLQITSYSAGSVDLVLHNIHAADPLNGAITIHFLIIDS